jgi:hypothetical protein
MARSQGIGGQESMVNLMNGFWRGLVFNPKLEEPPRTLQHVRMRARPQDVFAVCC